MKAATMPEQPPKLPESIAKNFDLYKGSSDLVVAVSRANHSYDQHPGHGEQPTELFKTRGMGYTETELGGQPFTIAERLQPRTPNQAPEPTETEEPKTKEQAWDKVDGKRIQYGEPDEHGDVTVGVLFERPGDVLKWAKNPNTSGSGREIIMTGKDGSVVAVFGNQLSYWKQSDDGQLKLERETELAEANHLPDTMIGGSWTIEGATEAEDITLGEVASAEFKLSDHYSAHEAAEDNLPKAETNPSEPIKIMLRAIKNKAEIERQQAEAERKRREADVQPEDQPSRVRRVLGKLSLRRAVKADASVRGKTFDDDKSTPEFIRLTDEKHPLTSKDWEGLPPDTQPMSEGEWEDILNS